MEINTVLLSLGTDLGNKTSNLEQAIKEIRQNIGGIVSISSVYESAPLGFVSDTTFLNLCLIVETTFSSKDILPEIKKIEADLGRKKKESQLHYESRLIDIDIIFFNHEIIASKKLIVPHASYRERNFVLIPLVEIAPGFIDPISHLSSVQLLKNCSDKSKVTKKVGFSIEKPIAS